MKLGEGELRARAREAAEQYRHCLLCAHRCGVDRTRGSAGRCQEGSSVFLAGAGLHFGEEPPLVGTRGSGLVLIAGCNLACAGCETAEFSLLRRGVARFGEDQLAGLFLDLQQRGAANLNLVTPTHVLPALRASGHGSIVLIGSTAGQRGEQGHSHYAASKGALQSLAMSLAVELAPRIRTNLVSPGWIRTPMAEGALRTIGPLVASTLPNRRLGEIEDVVNAVLYLSSDASSHLLGENLSVSGGALLVVPRGQLQPR